MKEKQTLTVDASVTKYTDPYPLLDRSVVEIQVVGNATDTRAGAVTLWASNNKVNWSQLEWLNAGAVEDALSVIASTLFEEQIGLAGIGAVWLRGKYVPSSGTGELDFIFSAKRG